MSPRLPNKKDVLIALLERSSVFVHLDPRREEARVPKWFKKQPQLVLQIGLNMAVQIPDLEVMDDGVGCTLSFSRSPYYCYLPYSAIYALVAEDGRGMVWPDDIPPEVVVQSVPSSQPSIKQAEVGDSNARDASLTPVAPGVRAPQSAPGKQERRGPSSSSLRAIAGGSVAPPAEQETAGLQKLVGSPEEGPASDKPRALPSYLRVVK